MSALNKAIMIFAALALSASLASCTTEDDFTDILADEDYVYTEQVKDKESGTESVQTVDEKTRIKELSQKALERMNELPEYPEGYPTLEDVVSQYKKANMAIGWIINTEQIATDETDTIVVDGMKYYRVKPDCHLGIHDHEHGEQAQLIYNKKTLEAYLATLIHPEEAADYMIDLEEGYDVPRLVSGSNGALYALPYFYTPEGYGDEETYELSENDDGSYIFTVNYTLKGQNGEEKPRSHSFPYVMVDGRWVFENFYVIKQ